MNFKSSSALPQAMRGVLATLVIASVVTAGVAGAASDSDSAPAAAASTKLETDTYLVEIAAVGPYKAGVPASVRVSLTTKGIFHINGQYPYRFKAAPPADGVSYPKPVLERADGQFTEKSAVFNLPFVASHAGTSNVGGVFHMSVCSPSSCLMQKAPLDISVIVQ